MSESGLPQFLNSVASSPLVLFSMTNPTFKLSRSIKVANLNYNKPNVEPSMALAESCLLGERHEARKNNMNISFSSSVHNIYSPEFSSRSGSRDSSCSSLEISFELNDS